MPSAWGSLPRLPTETPYAVASFLGSGKAPGFYESMNVSPGDRPGWVSEEGPVNSDLYWPIPKVDQTIAEAEPDPEWGHTLIYQSDFGVLAPQLSKTFEARLGKHPNPTRSTLIIPDPGEESWLDHFEDYSRVVGSGNQRGPTGTSTARGVRFFPLTVYANGSVPPYDQTHPLPSFTRQPLNSVQPISPSSSPSTSPPRSSRDYSRSARLKVANTVARTFVFWASIRRRTLGRDGSSLGRGRSVGWRIGRRPLGSAGMVLKGVGEKW